MLRSSSPTKTVCKCKHCGRESPLISQSLGMCLDYIRRHLEEVSSDIYEAHGKSREVFKLPARPPKAEDGISCHLCLNECRLLEGDVSYCGLRGVEGGKLVGASAELGNVSWYHDPLPTNCVADCVSPLQLAEAVDEHTSCICWETNGSMQPALLKQAAELSLDSGGCIKFDLKAWDEGLHIALCGVSNKRTFENFRLLAGYIERRLSPPFLVASTLLIPGYVDREEVSEIATFISSLDASTPYALLAFHPDFLMADLPATSLHHAQECLEAAKAAGLKRVRLGNIHLPGNNY